MMAFTSFFKLGSFMTARAAGSHRDSRHHPSRFGRHGLSWIVFLLVAWGADWGTERCSWGRQDLPLRLPSLDPQQVGLDSEGLRQMEPLIAAAIEKGQLPGCVVAVGRRGALVWLEAYGHRQLQPEPLPMTVDTVFDLASLTKPIATATSIMRLVDQGKLRLNQRVVDVLPEFSSHGKGRITIQQLLIHQSGLIADNPMADYQQGSDEAWQRICDLELVGPVGREFRYSDVNYLVLGQVVARLSGQDLHAFSQREIFAPLGMKETGFLPGPPLQKRAAPTERRDGHWIQGQVHDPRAHLLDGVAGHAGLFSTAEDLAIYAQMMLDRGSRDLGDCTVRILSPASARVMTADYPVSSGIRGLGWDKQTGFSSNKGDLLSEAAFGHGGFTGTVLWIDPQQEFFFIFLSNRVHPDGRGNVNDLAGRLLNRVVAAIVSQPGDAVYVPEALGRFETPAERPEWKQAREAAGTGEVLTGLDVLVRDDFRQLAGRQVGLITNTTGRDRRGRAAAELLWQAPDVKLQALFSPEHGYQAALDVARIDDDQDQVTGLTIFSLYGETRRPTGEMLRDVDTLVFDIQDIGARFYTYVSTMGEAMRAAAEHGRRFVVLDRPNPINGLDLAGPMLEPGRESFVGYHHLPVRHGMTAGEIALMLREELGLELDLQVIACEGWRRSDYLDATGLVWINPSPNMRNLNQALLYPGMGLWEMTNLSVGRGTDSPFERLGAPWIDAAQMAGTLRQCGLPGVRFVPVYFTPDSSKYAGQRCGGIHVIISDRAAFRPVDVGLAVAWALQRLYPQQWRTDAIDRLLLNRQLAAAIVEGQDLEQLIDMAHRDIETFRQRRAKFLLY